MRGSFSRGIFASMYFKSQHSVEYVRSLYKDYYQPSPFVHISSSPISVKNVTNTNNNLIYIDSHEDTIRIESAIDNLLKGAAGQAVQNMNIAMGWDESLGLKLKANAL